ncbi:unnamed protein product [Ectocarpus fasciculatus]
MIFDFDLGLEIHAQLKLKTKLFSPGSTDSQKNSALGLLDISLPGTLPRLNRRAIDQAVKAALALNCEINLMSHFDRKHYFYLDMPLGFQITQQDRPLGHSGSLSFRCPDENGTAVTSQVAVQRLQVEQDSAKSIHDMHDLYSLIDFSRAGSALVEVVFSPSLRTPKQAASVLATAQQLLRHIDVCNGNMEDGSMRCDVNVSVARYEDNSGDGSQPRVLTQGGRVEVKNLSSLQRVETAATYEIGRHIDLLLAGEAIPRETRGFDATTEKTFSLRAKEDAVDYRFFPDPDLPPLVISPEELDQYRVNMPELPEETISRIMDVYKLNDYQVSVLFSLQVLRRFEAAMDMVDSTKKEKLAAIMFNWITTDLAGVCSFNNMSIDEFPITVTQIYDIVCSIEQEQLTSQQIKKILICLFEDEKLRSMSVQEIASKLGLVKVSDEAVLKNLCLQAINDPKNAKELSKYRSGRLGMFNYFFGEVMKNSRGQADPIVVRSLLHSLLD